MPTAAATKPAKAIFFIDEQPIDFPPAKLVFQPRDGDMRIVLMSDDPPAAVRDRYVGNSFYFDVLLEKTTDADLDGAAFVFPESAGDGRGDRDDTSTGLFVHNGRETLSPAGAKIRFEKDDGVWSVRVAGTFRLIDTRSPDGPAHTVAVNAVLVPKVVFKE
jgi:hypothetical protein